MAAEGWGVMKSSMLIAVVLLLSGAAVNEVVASEGHRHFQGQGHFQGHRHFGGHQGHRHSHRHSRGPVVSFGFVAGPYWGPRYYAPYPYYAPYYPPHYSSLVVEHVSAPVYIERQSSEPGAASTARTGYWYYCGESKAYYPYVRDCPGGWQKVSPRPAGES
jgi:hypothetical protein